ncbi:MAG: hypothetical protein RL223_5086 [Pseudomonadota bacterium]|jgi:hypothetical protein|nr:hypothetical protein [Pseudomonadota bacterium]
MDVPDERRWEILEPETGVLYVVLRTLSCQGRIFVVPRDS